MATELPKDREAFAELSGDIGIGHVRYGTSGSSVLANAHPVIVQVNRDLQFGFAFNGNIANILDLKASMPNCNFQSDCDAEVLAELIASEYRKTSNLISAFRGMEKRIDGGYAIVLLTSRGELAAFRDPNGLRPLVFGRTDEGGVMFASESVAMNGAGFDYLRAVEPGELFLVKGNSGAVTVTQIGKPRQKAECMFEYVYFSRVESAVDGQYIYDVRRELGRRLANKYGHWPVTVNGNEVQRPDVIVAVPDTSRSSAEAISEVLGISVREGIIKDRFSVGRSFILPDQDKREEAVRFKHNPNPAVLRGRRVLLVEDSIVRGTTMVGLIKKLRKHEPLSIEVWVTCPPLVSICTYGINMSNPREFFAKDSSPAQIEKVRAKIGADRLEYLPLDELRASIPNPICTGCLNRVYPTPKGQELANASIGLNISGRVTEARLIPPKVVAPIVQ